MQGTRITVQPFRGDAEAEPTGSYEAAMRAADALFSPRVKAGPADGSANGSTNDLANGSPRSAGSGNGQGHADGAPAATASEPTGRVLRALDEPEPAVEPIAELAPKRRGRKPGSVNKPKTPETARRRLSRGSAAAPAAPEADGTMLALDTIESVESVADAAAPETDAVEAAARPPHAPPAAQATAKLRRDRFSWVRTKLKPGEKWKRRLPKVAW